MNILKELDRLGKKLKKGQPLQPFEMKDYQLYATMQTLIQLNARTEEDILKIEKKDLALTLHLLGELYFADQWLAMECVTKDEKKAEDIT